MQQLEVILLGYPVVRAGGRDVPIGLRRALGLLAFLADRGAPVPRGATAELLWPETAADTSSARLRRLIHRINASLGARVIDGGGDRLAFASGLGPRVDSRRFEALAHDGFAALDRPGDKPAAGRSLDDAIALHVGDFMAGFELDGCPEFEDWVRSRRSELTSLLARVLRRRVETLLAEGVLDAAMSHGERLVALDPFRESSYRLLMRAHGSAGDVHAVARAYERCRTLLWDELGVEPAAETRKLHDMLCAPASRAAPGPVPDGALPAVRFARNGDTHIAYASVGAGPTEIVLVPGFVSHIELVWEEPRLRRFLLALAGHARVTIMDRRGVGVSERLAEPPTEGATGRDIVAVMDHAGIERAVLFGASEGGPSCIRLAVDRPERVAGLVLFGTLAKGSHAADHPWALKADQFDRWQARLVASWGKPDSIETFAPSLAQDEAARAWWSRLLRQATSPTGIAAVLRALRDVDARPLLARVAVPTLVLHRRGDRAVRLEAGRFIATSIPGARFVALDGDDHWWWCGDADTVLAEITRFTAELDAAGAPIRAGRKARRG
jgi:DNA-binding SARP family transcriptional activator/pimeloyl-ACP methyl ester carboxylesterase